MWSLANQNKKIKERKGRVVNLKYGQDNSSYIQHMVTEPVMYA